MADRTIPAFKILRGNLGVGTTLPASKLHVYGSNAETTIAKIDGSLRMGVLNSYIKGPNDYKLLRFTNAGLVYNEDGAAALDFRMEGDTNTNLFLLDASADSIGIGEAPVSNASLFVGGSKTYPLRVQTTNAQYYFADSIIYGNSANGMYLVNQSSYLRFGANDAELMRLTGGKVGIGTNAPVKKLDVRAAASWDGIHIGSTAGSATAIDFARSTTNANPTARIGVAEPAATHTSDMRFFTSDASGSAPNLVEKMRIDQNGKVGIGTNAPGSLLNVGSSASANTTIRINSSLTAGSDAAAFSFGLDNHAFDFAGMRLDYSDRVTKGLEIFTATAYGYPITITPSTNKNIILNPSGTGKVLVQGTASYILDVQQTAVAWTARFENNGGAYGVTIDTANNIANNVANLACYTPSGVGLFFTNQGRLAIGLTAPTAALHVSSSASVVSYLIRPSASPTVHIGSSTSAGAQLGYVHANDYAFYGHDAAYNAIVVKSSGSVGIGTTNPSGFFQVGSITDSSTTAASLVHLTSATASSTVNGFSTLKLDYKSGHAPSTAGAQIMFNQGYHSGNQDYTAPVGSIRGWKTGASDNYGGGLQFLYQPDSGALGLLAGMTLEGSGNVGIGTNNPGQLLEVGSDGNTDYALIGPTKVGGGMGHGNYAGFSHRDMGGTGNYALIQSSSGHTYLNSASGQNLSFRINNSDTMYMSSAALQFNDNKKLILGNNSDLQLFHDGTNSYIQNGASGGHLSISLNGGAEYSALFLKDDAVKLFFNGVQQCETLSNGLKINNPANNIGYLFGGDGEILAGQDSGGYYYATGSGQNVSKPVFIGSNASYIKFKTANTERVRITSTGLVGIGTASALASSGEQLAVYSASTGHSCFKNSSDSTGTVYIRNASQTANTWQPYLILADSGGNRGGLALKYSTSGLKVHGQGGIEFWTGSSFGGGTAKVTIASNGNVTQAGGAYEWYDGSGSKVGEISTLGGNNLTISGTQTNHCGLSFATNAILPATQSATNNNTVDLGASGNAFKNFYIQGTAYVRNSGGYNILWGKGTGWGYSPNSYRAIQIGDASGNTTVSIGYDPAGNTNGSFTGDGGELLFRNDFSFMTPNAANNGWHYCMHFQDGKVSIGSASAPAYPLHVHGNAAFSNGSIVNIGTTGSNTGKVRFYNNNSTAYYVDWKSTGARSYEFEGSSSSSDYVTSFSNADSSGGHNLNIEGMLRVKNKAGNTNRFTVSDSGVVTWGSNADSGHGQMSWDTGKAYIYGTSGNALAMGANGNGNIMHIKTNYEVHIGAGNGLQGVAIHGNTSGYGSIVGVSRDGSSYKNLEINGATVEFKAAGTVKMTVASGGVGINVAPDGGLKIKSTGDGVNVLNLTDSSDDAMFNVRQSGNDCLIRAYKDGGSQQVQIHTDGDSYFNGGNFGIGTVPSHKLEVHDASSNVPVHFTSGQTSVNIKAGSNTQTQFTNLLLYSNGGNGQFWKAGTAYYSYGGANSLNIYNSNGKIAFHPNGSANKVLIDTNGYVGIGTNAPAQLLHMEGSVVKLRMKETGSQTWDLYAAGSRWALRVNDADKLTVNNGGNVGVGTDAPTNPLHVYNATNISPSSGGAGQFAITGSGYTGFIAMDGSAMYFGHNSSGRDLRLMTNETTRLYINGSGSVSVPGSFSASSKSFLIDHPTKENKKLEYGCLEGPEFGVYHRGRAQSDTITLPDYWTALVREETITVQLTSNGSFQHLYVVSQSLTEIVIGAADGETIDCFYTVYGERADIDSLVVEKEV